MKKIVFSCVLFILIIYSFFFPENTINATRNGIQIWFQQILPALLPFTIASTVLLKSNFLQTFKGNANLIAVLLTMGCGFIFGFPIGAKLSADFCKQNLLSEKQATVLAIATNNFSPMYVCGFALSLLFSSQKYNLITYILLYLIPLVLVTVYLFFDNKPSSKKTTSSFRLNMQIMDVGIISGFESLIKICGYIVLFSITTEIITSIVQTFITPLPLAATIIIGNLEITNGINILSQINICENIKYMVAIQLLAFGGLSGIAQTASILSDARLSIYKYIIGKVALSLLLTLLSVIYVLFIR